MRICTLVITCTCILLSFWPDWESCVHAYVHMIISRCINFITYQMYILIRYFILYIYIYIYGYNYILILFFFLPIEKKFKKWTDKYVYVRGKWTLQTPNRVSTAILVFYVALQEKKGPYCNRFAWNKSLATEVDMLYPPKKSGIWLKNYIRAKMPLQKSLTKIEVEIKEYCKTKTQLQEECKEEKKWSATSRWCQEKRNRDREKR